MRKFNTIAANQSEVCRADPDFVYLHTAHTDVCHTHTQTARYGVEHDYACVYVNLYALATNKARTIDFAFWTFSFLFVFVLFLFFFIMDTEKCELKLLLIVA